MASVPGVRAVVRSLLVAPVLLMLFGAEEASGTRPSVPRSNDTETSKQKEQEPLGEACWAENPITTLPGDSSYLNAMDSDYETGNILAAYRPIIQLGSSAGAS